MNKMISKSSSTILEHTFALPLDNWYAPLCQRSSEELDKGTMVKNKIIKSKQKHYSRKNSYSAFLTPKTRK